MEPQPPILATLTASEEETLELLGDRCPRDWDSLFAVLRATAEAKDQLKVQELDATIKAMLAEGISEDKVAALRDRQTQNLRAFQRSRKFAGLRKAVAEFYKFVSGDDTIGADQNEGFYSSEEDESGLGGGGPPPPAKDSLFFDNLLPFIWDWAHDFDAARHNDDVFLLRPRSDVVARNTERNDSEEQPTSDAEGDLRPRSEQPYVARLTRRYTRHVLANAFFLNDRWSGIEGFGNIDFDGVYSSPIRSAVERIKCQLSYFFAWMVDCEKPAADRALNDTDSVVVQRIRLTAEGTEAAPVRDPNRHWGIECDDCGAKSFAGSRSKCVECRDFDLCQDCAAKREAQYVETAPSGSALEHASDHAFFLMRKPEEQQAALLALLETAEIATYATPSWANMTQVKMDPDLITVHTDDMETPTTRIFVDFANRDLQIHCIIPSLTQEEVLFSVCPECFPAMLFVERLRPDEAVVIKNVRRFSKYSGYLSTFRFVGFYDEPELREHDVIAIDATFRSHFDREVCARDVNKAFLGFSPFAGREISTGHWGCGAFGGDKVHKFLQQWLAAQASNCHLQYSTFNDNYMRARLIEIARLVAQSGLSVSELFDLQGEYGADSNSKLPFDDWFEAQCRRRISKDEQGADQ